MWTTDLTLRDPHSVAAVQWWEEQCMKTPGLPAYSPTISDGVPVAQVQASTRAIVGDFQSGIRWSIQRDLPIELIRFGDPDGQGDLKRKNQVALRLEIVYGWYPFVNRFAVIEDKL